MPTREPFMNRGHRTALAAIAIAAVAAAVPLAAGASQQATATPKQYVVKLLALQFSRSTITTAKAGDTVKFVWVEGVHNVVSTATPAKVPKVNSGPPVAKDSLKITLKKGRYDLLCVPHASVGMRLTIRVK
jgi:plastocyanin